MQSTNSEATKSKKETAPADTGKSLDIICDKRKQIPSKMCEIPKCEIARDSANKLPTVNVGGEATKLETSKESRLAEKIKAWCKQISMGGMSIYEPPQVNTTRDYINKIATVQVGPSSAHWPSSPGKVLMVVGATGAGKTTLINAMVNYLFGVDWKGDFRFKMIVEKAAKDQTKSITKWITAYTIPAQEDSPIPYTLTIIDTPGFGDTEGIEQDKLIAQQVKGLFSKKGRGGIDQLHGIGFVVQASLARLTHTQRYIFDSILTIFGKDVRKNVFMMMTFADGQTPKVLDAVKAANVPHETYFKFNNSALYSDDKTNVFDRMFWEMGTTSMREFFTYFGKMTPTSILLTKVVLEERERLEVILQGLQDKINWGLSQCENLRETKEVVKQHEAAIRRNEQFQIKSVIEEPHKIKIDQGEYTTNCLKCNYTCHFPCIIPKNDEKKGCAAMYGTEYCKKCSGKCHWTQHVNDQYRIVWKEREVIKTFDDLKQKYHNAKSDKSHYESVVAGLKQDLFQKGEDLRSNLEEARRCIKRLDEIALKPNPLSEVEYINLQIESEKKQRNTGFIKRISILEKLRDQAELISRLRTPSGEISSSAMQLDWWAFWTT